MQGSGGRACVAEWDGPVALTLLYRSFLCVFYCALLYYDGEQIREVLNSERCAQLSENKRGVIEIFHNVAHSEHFEIVSGMTPHIFADLCKWT